jgi:hypothetical protein
VFTTCGFPDYFCTYAIHGRAFVEKRGRSFWEPEDALSAKVTVAPGGLLVIDCETPEDSTEARRLLDAQGLLPGVDYGIGSRVTEPLPCQGIVFENSYGLNVSASGNSDWKLPPMPEHIRNRLETESEQWSATRYEASRKLAVMLGVNQSKLEQIDKIPKASARKRALTLAIRAKGDGRG